MTPSDFCRKLQIPESCASLIEQALTHRSALAEGAQQSNERLEFLGDAVLSLIVTEELFYRFPDRTEGDLSRARALVVSRRTLAQAAKQLGVGQWLRLSASEEAQGGRQRSSILAGAMEAIIAVVYLQEGLEAARQFVRSVLGDVVHRAPDMAHCHDYKSRLQEKTHALWRLTPVYEVIAATGADHDKTFRVQVRLGEKVLGTGTGKSKKEAEQAAAREAMIKLATTHQVS